MTPNQITEKLVSIRDRLALSRDDRDALADAANMIQKLASRVAYFEAKSQDLEQWPPTQFEPAKLQKLLNDDKDQSE